MYVGREANKREIMLFGILLFFDVTIRLWGRECGAKLAFKCVLACDFNLHRKSAEKGFCFFPLENEWTTNLKTVWAIDLRKTFLAKTKKKKSISWQIEKKFRFHPYINLDGRFSFTSSKCISFYCRSIVHKCRQLHHYRKHLFVSILCLFWLRGRTRIFWFVFVVFTEKKLLLQRTNERMKKTPSEFLNGWSTKTSASCP